VHNPDAAISHQPPYKLNVTTPVPTTSNALDPLLLQHESQAPDPLSLRSANLISLNQTLVAAEPRTASRISVSGWKFAGTHVSSLHSKLPPSCKNRHQDIETPPNLVAITHAVLSYSRSTV
jgi:hypothetical protein